MENGERKPRKREHSKVTLKETITAEIAHRAGKSTREIGRLMGRPFSTVRLMLERAASGEPFPGISPAEFEARLKEEAVRSLAAWGTTAALAGEVVSLSLSRLLASMEEDPTSLLKPRDMKEVATVGRYALENVDALRPSAGGERKRIGDMTLDEIAARMEQKREELARVIEGKLVGEDAGSHSPAVSASASESPLSSDGSEATDLFG